VATKIQRARRVGGIAIGAVKAIFRTGKAWGTTRTRVATIRHPPTVPSGAALAAGVAGGAAGAYFLDPKSGTRRRRAVGRRVPAIRRATALVRAVVGWLMALVRRRASWEEAEERVDTEALQMAAGNGAGGPVPAKETEPVAAGV
jgi:hypothetical protein